MPTTLPMGRLALDRREQVGDVVTLEQQLPQPLERGAPLGGAGRRLAVPPRAGLSQGAFVLVALGLDRLPRGGQPRRQRRRLGARLPRVANLVELLVEREHLFEQAGGHLRVALVAGAEREAFDRQQVLDARHRLLQRPVGVVQIRRALEAREAFGRSGVVVEVGVELAAQVAEAAIEILAVDFEPPRQTEEGEIVALPVERLDPAALRAEVLVYRHAAAAVAALWRRNRT